MRNSMRIAIISISKNPDWIWMIVFEYSRNYMSDEEVLAAVGKDEYNNISEFRNPSKLCYQIKLE